MNVDRIKATRRIEDGGATRAKGSDRTTKGTTDDGTKHHRHDGEITEQATASGGEMSATEHKCIAAGGAKLSETEVGEDDARSLLEVRYSITYLLAPMPIHSRNRFNQLKTVFKRDLISESCCFNGHNDPLTSIGVRRYKTY